MDMQTFLSIVATICITEKVLSGEGEQLNPCHPLLTAAGTPELRAPRHGGPGTRRVSAHWALGLGPSEAWRGSRGSAGRQAGRGEDEGCSPRAKGKSGQTNGVEPVYLGWKR